MKVLSVLAVTLVLASCAGAPGDGAGLTASQAGTAFSAVYPHWELQCDEPGFATTQVTFDVQLDAWGRLVSEPTLVAPEDTDAYRTVAASALTALKAAEPYPVPRGFTGGQFRPTFRADRACATK
ncbi:hypothetical protein ACETK8_03540 [Brevundimonas staleyi]|uniref:Energy transducer TonB n=1 Tax=Brevundimonas staleyi TaxID=74326 RepID=A0ABW0FVG4_9CAUL